jgi:uncharacterized membrane protein YdjX (TVP38/TMEM64 family)
MTPVQRSRLIKIVVASVWFLAIFCIAYSFHQTGIPVRRLPRFVYDTVRGYGYWGPFVLVALYVTRSYFFVVPSSVLTLVAGSLYGPVFGTMINVVGDNLSAAIGFTMGRFFGRRFVKEHEHGWIQTYDQVLREEGFFAVLVMRLLFFPFDVVNYGCGMTGMLFRQFALATLLGTLPAIITVTTLGHAFESSEEWFVFIILLLLIIVSLFLLRRSVWVRSRLFPKHLPPEHIL